MITEDQVRHLKPSKPLIGGCYAVLIHDTWFTTRITRLTGGSVWGLWYTDMEMTTLDCITEMYCDKNKIFLLLEKPKSQLSGFGKFLKEKGL